MRENRTHGSEGRETGNQPVFLTSIRATGLGGYSLSRSEKAEIATTRSYAVPYEDRPLAR